MLLQILMFFLLILFLVVLEPRITRTCCLASDQSLGPFSRFERFSLR